MKKSSFPVTKDKVRLIKKLFSAEEVENKIEKAADKIVKKYLPLLQKEEASFRLVFVGVLNGAVWFTTDLAMQAEKYFNHAGYFGFVEWDFVSISSYPEGTEPNEIRFLLDTKRSIAGAYVILVEDIIDTGNTAYWVKRLLTAKKPSGLELFVLLNKIPRREKRVKMDYVAFQLDEPVWVLGRGLDCNGKFRALEGIYYAEFVEKRLK